MWSGCCPNLQYNAWQEGWQFPYQTDGLISLDMENVLHISWSACTKTYNQWADGRSVATQAGKMGRSRNTFFLTGPCSCTGLWSFTDLRECIRILHTRKWCIVETEQLRVFYKAKIMQSCNFSCLFHTCLQPFPSSLVACDSQLSVIRVRTGLVIRFIFI